MITALSGVMDDLVGPFPCGAEFSFSRVFGCWGDLARDEVSYVKLSELHSLVVVLGHLLLVLSHLVGGFLFNFV